MNFLTETGQALREQGKTPDLELACTITIYRQVLDKNGAGQYEENWKTVLRYPTKTPFGRIDATVTEECTYSEPVKSARGTLQRFQRVARQTTATVIRRFGDTIRNQLG